LSEKQLGPAVTKLRNIFVDDLTIAATVGECPECLYAVMIALSEMWWTDTELIEGANNIIKMLGKISPSIRHRLTSARFLIKKLFAKLSNAVRADVLEKLMPLHTDAIAFQDADEYVHLHDVVDPATYPICGAPSKADLKERGTSDELCAASILSQIMASMTRDNVSHKPDCNFCLVVRDPDAELLILFTTLVHCRKRWATRCAIQNENFGIEDYGLGALGIVVPLDQRLWIEFLADLHAQWVDRNGYHDVPPRGRRPMNLSVELWHLHWETRSFQYCTVCEYHSLIFHDPDAPTCFCGKKRTRAKANYDPGEADVDPDLAGARLLMAEYLDADLDEEEPEGEGVGPGGEDTEECRDEDEFFESTEEDAAKVAAIFVADHVGEHLDGAAREELATELEVETEVVDLAFRMEVHGHAIAIDEDDPRAPGAAEVDTDWDASVLHVLNVLNRLVVKPLCDRCISLVIESTTTGDRSVSWIFWDDANPHAMRGRRVVIRHGNVMFTVKSAESSVPFVDAIRTGAVSILVRLRFTVLLRFYECLPT